MNKLLALDLDGTLLHPSGGISPRNIAAINAARARGFRVIICTGRGLIEAAAALDAVGRADPVVVAGGSIIADPISGHTLHRFAIDLDLVHSTINLLHQFNYPALVLKDPVATGYDYFVAHGPDNHPLDPVTAWWFEKMNVKVRAAQHAHEDEHPDHTVRVGACGLASHLEQVMAALERSVADRAVMHHFPAVVAPEHASRLPSGDKLHILEMFHAHAHKWSALRVLADQWNIDSRDIVAIGDEINDLSMISNAGTGIAMGNAIPAIKAAAKHTTLPNHQDGVAVAIENVLSGAW
jgi:hydroxymethylpyrimidine pyrophosphatase-like HAD family hydrolase